MTELRDILQSFKVPISAERSRNGIRSTQRAQMAPKSLEPLWKGQSWYRRATHTYSQPPSDCYSETPQAGFWILQQLSRQRAAVVLFKKRNREKNRRRIWLAVSPMGSRQRLDSIRSASEGKEDFIKRLNKTGKQEMQTTKDAWKTRVLKER